jgi:hypothetical protein
MTFNDARRILAGGNTSATEYFKTKTSERLAASLKPIIASAREETGVVKQHQQFAGGIQSLPFARRKSGLCFVHPGKACMNKN